MPARSSATGLDAFVAARRVVAVIEGAAKLRDEMVAALASGYWVVDFPDVADAVARLRVPPAAIVLGRPASKLRTPVRDLRAAAALRNVPIVRWQLPGAVADRLDLVPDAAGDASAGVAGLRDLVATLTTGVIERSWERLPESPRLALQRSRAVFQDLASLVPTGQSLAFSVVTDACGPLLSAVQRSEHRWVFDGLRGHDDFDYAHSVRMAALLGMFGMAAGLADSELMTLVSGGFVHDIGMAALPLEVKAKVTAFTDTDVTEMRRHVTLTVDYLERRSDTPRSMITVAAHHHERIDGSGYPHGLKGSQVNDLARMAAIADVFAALTEDRPYRAAMSAFQALEVMGETMLHSLDQRLVRLFRGVLLDAVT